MTLLARSTQLVPDRVGGTRTLPGSGMVERIRTAFLAVLALAVIAPSAGRAQVGVGESNGMKVTLSLRKTEILVGEPLFLNVNIENVRAPLRVGNFGARLYLSEGNDLEVMVQPPGELPQRYVGAEDPALFASIEIDLDNGEREEHELTLLYDRNSPNGLLFSTPGIYTVSVKLTATILRDPKRVTVTLPPTRVRVTAPQGKAAEALALISTPELAKALHALSVTSQNILPTIRKIADQYAETPYAPLARFLSGLAYYRSTPPEAARAEGDFRKFLSAYPAHPRTADVAYMMVALHSRIGNFDKARDWYYYVQDAYPHYNLLRKENVLATYYYFNPLEAMAVRPWWLYQKPWFATMPEPDQEQGGVSTPPGMAE